MMTPQETDAYIAEIHKELELCKSDAEVLQIKERVTDRFQQERLEMLAQCEAMQREYEEKNMDNEVLAKNIKNLTVRLQALNKENARLKAKLATSDDSEPPPPSKSDMLRERLRRKLEARGRREDVLDTFVGYQWKH
jgi:cell division protein FtsB